MAQLRITNIIKPNVNSPHEHITHVGNTIDSWLITREEAVDRILRKTDSFYVYDAKTNKAAFVDVRYTSSRFPYLQTYSDGIDNDNLLSLPQWPR
jgi:hypothetical protein